jgi:DNA polymerase I-like protein with 3'-5' exonuclease and polymerase domains
MMAWKIQDGTKRESRLLYYFEGGGPGYIGLAKDLLKMTVKKGTKQYKAIKAIYLGLGYNMNDWKLAHDLWFKVGLRFSEDWDEHVKKTKKIRKKYFRMFPEVKDYHRHQKRELEKTQQVVAELGMVRHLPHLGPEMDGYKHLENQAINLPMQYLASLVTGSAMVDYEAALLKEHHLSYVEWHEALLVDPYNLPCSPLINEVHDQLDQDLHPKTGKKDLKILHDAMVGVPTLRRMLPNFRVKLTVNETVGEAWT